MLRKTSIAIAISLTLAAAGSTSPASASSILRSNLWLGQPLTSLESSQNAEASAKKLFCIPIPVWPWCI